MKTNAHYLSYLTHFFLEYDFFWTKFLESIKTHVLYSIFFSPENRTVCEMKWKNTVQPDRPQMTI